MSSAIDQQKRRERYKRVVSWGIAYVNSRKALKGSCEDRLREDSVYTVQTNSHMSYVNIEVSRLERKAARTDVGGHDRDKMFKLAQGNAAE